MDIQAFELRIGRVRFGVTAVALFAIAVLGVLLRLKGIHNPILDHPNWRQGDMASVARNFATLTYNILYPQTNYNGPPPNYVELELQIVPFLAATAYKMFGVHEIFGRLITLGFSVATIPLLFAFGRWLFSSERAGLLAALLYAIYPGAVFYGRTFTPDETMVFFMVAALYACSRLIIEDEAMEPRRLARATALLALALLAKPVSALILVPIIWLIIERVRSGRTMRPTAALVLVGVPLFILAWYDHNVSAHAEWHWASGITEKHVIPSMIAALTSLHGFMAKARYFVFDGWLFARTMLGWVGFGVAVASMFVLPRLTTRTPAILWGWLLGGLMYVYVVVTVERVDYYMLPLVPLFALTTAGALDLVMARFRANTAMIGVTVLLASIWYIGHRAVAPYYAYSKPAYRDAIALNATLPKHALVVMGHYGPDVLYYIGRYGWEEDPYIWTTFDEESAIRKGARYFISVEDGRFRHNLELCAWMQRFPLLDVRARWPVYVTDPLHEKPRADAFWRAFRVAERAGNGRTFLNAHHVCEIHP